MLQGAPKSSMLKLQRVQNNLARIVLQLPRRTQAQPLLYRLHWLPVELRIAYKTALITYKVRAQSANEYLLTLLQNRECTRTLWSSSLPLLEIPRFRTVTASRSFRVAAPAIWNTLPRDVLTCSTVDSLKKHLKNISF